MKLFSKCDKKTPDICASMKDGQKEWWSIDYRANRGRRYRKLLKGLLNKAENVYQFITRDGCRWNNDDEDDDDDDDDDIE